MILKMEVIKYAYLYANIMDILWSVSMFTLSDLFPFALVYGIYIIVNMDLTYAYFIRQSTTL